MHTHPFHAQQGFPRHGVVSFAAVLALLLIPLGVVRAQGTRESNTQPLAFGPDQTIIDLNNASGCRWKLKGCRQVRTGRAPRRR